MYPTKKYFVLLLSVMVLFALPALVQAQEQISFQSEEELIEFLRDQRSDERVTVEFTCDEELYAYLSAGDFKELQRLLYRAGIDGRGAWISYSDKTCAMKLTFSSTNNETYECQTAADVEFVLSALAENKTGREEKVYLLCSSMLYGAMTGNKKSFLYYPAAKHGIYNLYDYSYDNLEMFELSGLSLIEKPYAYAEDNTQFAAAVDQFKNQELEEFYVVFSSEMFSRIIQNKAEWKSMIAGSKLEGYIVNARGQGGTMEFSSVSYTDVARSICRETQELSGIISQMGASGITEFEIFFPDTTVFEELQEDDFALLHEIEAEAGLTSAEFSFSMSHDVMHYKDAVIVSDVVALGSLSEAVSYTEEKIAAGDCEISLFCTEELYSDLLGDLTAHFVVIPDGMTRIYDLLSQAGICDYELTSFPATHVISISVKRLFPGTAIMLAEKSGDDSALTDRERETLDEAKKIAEDARNDDPLMTAKYIHDWLCEKNTYTNDEDTDEDDTAIGAILNGEANCDGYTDAFYLIGSLAGLNVRYQHGDSYEKGFALSVLPITHIWNLLNIDDEWRMVDVTWDDNGDYPVYVWFNVGEDVASLMHLWNYDMTVSLAPETNRKFFADNEFYAEDASEVQAILEQVSEENPEEFILITQNLTEDEVTQLVRDNLTAGRIRYSWNEKMNMLTVKVS